MAVRREKYPYAETLAKALHSLEHMRAMTRPGEENGLVERSTIIRAMRSELAALMRGGWTARQIAEALKADVFGISPKAITQVARQGKSAHGGTGKPRVGTSKRTSARVKEHPKSARAVVQTTASAAAHASGPQPVPGGRFYVHSDTSDDEL